MAGEFSASEQELSEWVNGSCPRFVQVLEEKHAITVMMYLSMHDGCRKSDIYRDVSRNPRMPDKLDMLESNGLIVQEPLGDRNSVRISLTEIGRVVADLLCEIDTAMKRVLDE